MMEEIPTFITDKELVVVVVEYGLIFALGLIVTFLMLYKYMQIKKMKELIRKNKDLTTMEPHRSNGKHKEEVHGH